MITHMPESRCLNCGHKFNAASAVDGNDAEAMNFLARQVRKIHMLPKLN